MIVKAKKTIADKETSKSGKNGPVTRAKGIRHKRQHNNNCEL